MHFSVAVVAVYLWKIHPPARLFTVWKHALYKQGVRLENYASQQRFREELEKMDETVDSIREGHQGIHGGYQTLAQPCYHSNSNSYYYHPAYPQHGPHPDVFSYNYQ